MREQLKAYLKEFWRTFHDRIKQLDFWPQELLKTAGTLLRIFPDHFIILFGTSPNSLVNIDKEKSDFASVIFGYQIAKTFLERAAVFETLLLEMAVFREMTLAKANHLGGNNDDTHILGDSSPCILRIRKIFHTSYIMYINIKNDYSPYLSHQTPEEVLLSNPTLTKYLFQNDDPLLLKTLKELPEIPAILKKNPSLYQRMRPE